MGLLKQSRVLLFPFIFLFIVIVPPKSLAGDFDSSKPNDRRQVLIIDPGHGGHDLGSVGANGLAEKEVALVLAELIRDILHPFCSVRLTRDRDYWVDIETRTAQANASHADIFVSLHAGASFNRNTLGMAIFIFGPTSSLEWPHKERPFVDPQGDLRPWDRIQTTHKNESKLLAGLLQKTMQDRLEWSDRGVQQAPILLLGGADMPAVLVEVGYMTHPVEEQQLKDSKRLSDIAHAVADGIKAFFEQTGSCIQK